MIKLQILAFLSVALAASFGFTRPMNNQLSVEVSSPAIDKDFVPVEDMHHFMEYVCEPSYKAVRSILSEEPQEWTQWKKFRNHALVLAATSELVASRVPDDLDEEGAQQWKEISLEVHRTGALLYRSSRKYEEAKKHFSDMIDQCNKCHEVFDSGKHQLKK